MATTAEATRLEADRIRQDYDNTPSHAYLKALYQYPQQAFPYPQLVDANQNRGCCSTNLFTATIALGWARTARLAGPG